MTVRRPAARLLAALCADAPAVAQDVADDELAGVMARDPDEQHEGLLRLYGGALYASASCEPATAPRTAGEWDATLSGVPALTDAAAAWRAVGRPLRGSGFDDLLAACRLVLA